MSIRQRVAADGSSHLDAHPRIEIDLEDDVDRMRFRCPNGHTSWSRTNSHLWCRSCANAHDLDPEHYELLDKKTESLVPWSAVELVE